MQSRRFSYWSFRLWTTHVLESKGFRFAWLSHLLSKFTVLAHHIRLNPV